MGSMVGGCLHFGVSGVFGSGGSLHEGDGRCAVWAGRQGFQGALPGTRFPSLYRMGRAFQRLGACCGGGRCLTRRGARQGTC